MIFSEMPNSATHCWGHVTAWKGGRTEVGRKIVRNKKNGKERRKKRKEGRKKSKVKKKERKK